MEFRLPYPPIRPSPAKSAAVKKTSRLALKDKMKDNKLEKENQLVQQKKFLSQKSASLALRAKTDPFASLISSDESDSDNEQLFIDSTLHDSRFPLPKFESTRLESNQRNDTEQGSFFSCKSNFTQSLSNSDTSDGACEDSIICISDEELTPVKTGTKVANRHSPVKVDYRQSHISDVKSKTIVLESSSEDDESIFKKHQTGKAILSQLNKVPGKTAGLEWRKTVISSSTSDSEDVIESSYTGHQRAESNSGKNDLSPPAAGRPLKENDGSERERLVIPESPESIVQTDTLQDSREISPTAIIAEKLSNTKIADIERWLHRNYSSDESKICSEAKKESLASPETPEKKQDDKGIVISESPSSEDSFDKMLKTNIKKAPAKTQPKSFINDNSSDDESFTPYHRDMVKVIKDDLNNPKTPFGSSANDQKKPSPKGLRRNVAAFSSDSSSDSDIESSSSSSDWEPGMTTVKKRGKPVNNVRRKPRALILDDSETEPPTSGPPKDRRKSSEERKKKPLVTPKPKEINKAPFVTPKSNTKKGKVQELKKDDTPYSPIRTFLTSLSGPPQNVGMRNHPEASIYYKHYKSKKEELARRLFKLYNREVFDSRLPDDMALEWNTRMPSTAGYCSCKMIRKAEGTIRTARIVLSTKILDSADRLRDTLIHELCHAAVWLLNNISGGHGPFWKAWAAKAERRFPELPPIKRCHEYQIQTKFTYRCTDCGYSFGRHSKSLDLKVKRCGHCYGTFEVLVNKQTKAENGAPVATPSTPKPPTGFALFVKENYADIKKEHQDKKHGDIMKLLSQKFAEVKINR